MSTDLMVNFKMEIYRLRCMLALERAGIDTTDFGMPELAYFMAAYKEGYTAIQAASTFSGRNLECYMEKSHETPNHY